MTWDTEVVLSKIEGIVEEANDPTELVGTPKEAGKSTELVKPAGTSEVRTLV